MSQKYILFIPGYYGSILKEESGKIRWAKASNFFLSQHGVSEIIPGTNIGSNKKLIVGDVLKNVKVFPAVWDVDSYGKTLKQLGEFARKHEMQLLTAPYDWRDDFNKCLQAIDQKINSLHLSDSDELYVVAHSLGALLMSYYIRYGTQDVENAVENWEGLKFIKKVVLVAPPLHGLMILFRDMEVGTRLGLNRRLLSGKDYSSFKSSYFFLPPKNEDLGFNMKKEMVSIGIHDINKWEENSWGPFKYASFEEKPAVKAFVQKYMSRSEKFHALLRAEILTQPPLRLPLLHLRGTGQPTLELASPLFKNDKIQYRFKKEGAVDGDGTVTDRSGKALDFFKALDFTTKEIKLGHLDILVKAESQILIQDFLRG